LSVRVKSLGLAQPAGVPNSLAELESKADYGRRLRSRQQGNVGVLLWIFFCFSFPTFTSSGYAGWLVKTKSISWKAFHENGNEDRKKKDPQTCPVND
jgi:hypothetical protein